MRSLECFVNKCGRTQDLRFTLIFMIKVFGWFMFWRIFYFNCTAVLVKYQTRISTAVLNLLLQSTKNIMNESCSVSGYAEHGAEHMHGAGHGAGRARAGPRMIMRSRTCVLGADRRQAHMSWTAGSYSRAPSASISYIEYDWVLLCCTWVRVLPRVLLRHASDQFLLQICTKIKF